MTHARQPTLFPAETRPRPLTDRQAAALELLQRAGREGLHADELGAALCDLRGRHAAGDRCDYDKANGLGVLRALRTKGVAKSRREGTWYAIKPVESDAVFGELPEGF